MASVTRDRLSAAIQRHGPRSLATAVKDRLVGLAYLDEHHVWYVLDLANVPELTLADGYALRRVEDGAKLERVLIDVRPEIARSRLSEGHQLWVVERGAEPAFNCFIFFGQTPVRAAAGRSLALPPDTVCLEDSVTAAAHRGHGIAGAAWSAIARGLHQDGLKVLITKVAVDNVPSRKAVEKVAFVAAEVMHLRRRGVVEHVAVEPEPVELTPAARATAEALARSLVR